MIAPTSAAGFVLAYTCWRAIGGKRGSEGLCFALIIALLAAITSALRGRL